MKASRAIYYGFLAIPGFLIGLGILLPALAMADNFKSAALGIGDEDTNFKSYRPSYFGIRVNHTNKDNNGEVKFQLSLKYQITKNDVAQDMTFVNPVLSNWYFGYTQKSFWSIQHASAPFREINFSPEFFKEIYWAEKDEDTFKFLRFGLFQHESTGEAGIGSHGWNISYLEPVFNYKYVTVAPKIWVPTLFVSRKTAAPDNPDIFDYYGYADLKVFYDQNDHWHHSLSYRQGKSRKFFGSQWQTEYKFNPENLNTKIFIQYWAGYGESLKDYNVKTNGVVVGFSAVY